MARKFERIQCSAISRRTGEQCNRWARKGYSVCPMHGAGTKSRPGGRPIKTGLHSKILKRTLKEKISAYRERKDLTDIRHNIALQRVLLAELLKKANKHGKFGIATINNAVQILNSISQNIERLEKIEHGIKHTISVTVFNQSINLIVHVLDRNIRDEKVKARIFKEFSEYGIGGTSEPVARITEAKEVQPG